MKRYDSFIEMAKDTNSVEQEVLNRLETIGGQPQVTDSQPVDNRQSVAVNNVYGYWKEPSCDVFSEVMISITSSQIQDKLIKKFGDYDAQNVEAWDWLKAQSFDITVEIGVSAKAEDSKESRKTNASFNTRTGVLSVGGAVIGTLPVNPIDAIISTVDKGGSQLIPAAEKVIWDFVNNNPEKFIGGQNNGRSH